LPALAKIRHTYSNFELNATIHSEQLHDNRERKLTSNLEAPCSAPGERRMPSSGEQVRHHKRPILGEAATAAFLRARGRPQAPSTVRTTIESEIPLRRLPFTHPASLLAAGSGERGGVADGWEKWVARPGSLMPRVTTPRESAADNLAAASDESATVQLRGGNGL
jgi:hypothetical protein